MGPGVTPSENILDHRKYLTSGMREHSRRHDQRSSRLLMITENDVRYAQKMVALKYAVEAIDWYHQGKTRWWRPGWWVQRYLTRMYESILDEKTAIHMIDAAKGEIE